MVWKLLQNKQQKCITNIQICSTSFSIYPHKSFIYNDKQLYTLFKKV